MSVELKRRDADLLSDILADYLDNVAAENTVTKQCEMLLAKLGHYDKIKRSDEKYPLPSLFELIEAGVTFR